MKAYEVVITSAKSCSAWIFFPEPVWLV